MADYTKYLRLMKPAGNEYYNVENFNHNAELIDKETEKLNTAVTKNSRRSNKRESRNCTIWYGGRKSIRRNDVS